MITIINGKHDKRTKVIYIGRKIPDRSGSPPDNSFKASKSAGDPH